MDFNTVLEKIGDFGLYQKLLCALLVVPSASLCALIYFAQFFIILVPKHRCRISNDTLYNQENLSLPYEERDGQFLPKQCEMYGNMSAYVGNESMEMEIIPCTNGWVYDFSELNPSIATELDWVCEEDHVPYQIQTIFYVGTSLGCIIFGLIADKFGRRPSIILSYLLACGAGIGSAFASSFYSFAAFRFFVGAGIIPLSEDPYVLSLEYIGVKKRTLAIVLWAFGYITFSAICPWFAYGLKSWKLLCIVTSAPLAIVALIGVLIPESASWLLTQNRKADAIKMLKTVAKVNGKEFPEEFESEEKLADESEEVNVGVSDLFRTPRMRRNSIILATTWFIVYCCYHTNTQNASNLGTSVYDSFTYSALVEIPAQLVILFGIDWLGRRWPVVIASFIAGIAGLFIMCVPEDSPTSFLCVALVQRVTLVAVYNIIIQYSSELYPTVLRGRGLAFLRMMGTLGLYLSPSIVYLANTNPAFPILVSGCMMLGISAISLLLPETLNQHLPHSVNDAEHFGTNQQILDCPCINKGDSLEDCKEEEL